MLSLTQLLIALPIALTVSTLGTLAGIGGGVFMVPLLVYVFGIPLKEAIAAITFCLLPAALLSTYFNARLKSIDYFAGITLEIPTIIGAIGGAILINHLPVLPLKILFCGLIFFMARKMLGSAQAENTLVHQLNTLPPIIKRKDYAVSLSALSFIGLFSGVIAGLFGIGGGIVKTPVMIHIFKMPPKRATATALFMIVFTSLSASISHWSFGRLHWDLALPISLGFLAGSLVGNKINSRIAPEKIKLILGWMMLLAGIFILTNSVFEIIASQKPSLE
jgi:hypothetical protein